MAPLSPLIRTMVRASASVHRGPSLARAEAVRAICGTIRTAAPIDPARPSARASGRGFGQPPATTVLARSATCTSNGQRRREPPNPVSAVSPRLSSAHPASSQAAGRLRATATPNGASAIAKSHGASMNTWAAAFHAAAEDADAAKTPSWR